MKKIRTTKDLKLNSVVRVYKKGYGYSKIIVIDNTEHFLSVSANNEFINHVDKGDTVEAYYWVEHNASYEFPLEVLGKFEIDLKLLFFKHTDNVTWSEERKCLTAEVDIPFSFFTFSVDDTAKVFSTRDVEFLRGRIVTLGDREAVIAYSGSVDEDAFVKGHICLEGGDIPVMGKLVPLGNGSSGRYMIEFTGMNEKERDQLLDYIFTIYRE